MVELNWHDYVVMVSFVASIVGLVLLGDRKSQPTDDRTFSEETLIKMSFIYSKTGSKAPLLRLRSAHRLLGRL